MAIVAADWKLTRSTGIIDYIGTDHGVAGASYATVIELHRWLQDLADDPTSSGDDQMDITDVLPSSRATDNLITLIGGVTITDAGIEHLYDGSIVQGTVGVDQKIWDGIVNFGNEDVVIQLIQNGAVTTDDYWNTTPDGETVGGINRDNAAGISHRFMVLVHDFAAEGGDIDGRRLIGTSRTYNASAANTFGEFKINGTARGNNVLALKDATDLNKTTAFATVAAIDDIYIDRTASSTTVSGVNSTGQAVLNVVDGTQFTAGDFIMTGVATDNTEYQILSIATNALTLNHNLQVATAGGETVYDLNMGFTQIDVDNNASNEDYYAQWDKGANSINTFYERLNYLSRDGSLDYIYGISGELFRGITHEITVDTPTGTFAQAEAVSWGTGATAGTGQMLAINSPTAATKMWIQLLTGVVPTDGLVITGGITGATVAMNVTITDRSALVATPFVGTSTGSALIGSYGLALQTTDLATTDKVFDLTNAQITPPNNVTFTLSGLISTEDSIHIGPWDGVSTDANGDPEIDYNQLSLLAAITTDNITTVTIGGTGATETTIPTDTPATGFIRVKDDNGFLRKLHYTSRSTTAFTIDTTDGQEDFLSVNASANNFVYIAYLDKVAAATSESFTFVYAADREFVIKVRDGGGTPIKEYITSGTMGTNGGSSSAIRTTDA